MKIGCYWFDNQLVISDGYHNNGNSPMKSKRFKKGAEENMMRWKKRSQNPQCLMEKWHKLCIVFKHELQNLWKVESDHIKWWSQMINESNNGALIHKSKPNDG